MGYGLTADLPGHTATIPQVNVSSGSAVIRASALHDQGPNGQAGSAAIRNVEGACDPGEWILLGPAGQQRPYQVASVNGFKLTLTEVVTHIPTTDAAGNAMTYTDVLCGTTVPGAPPPGLSLIHI